eukprot:1142640-Pelagomonas_calceolata.AAC.14
MSSSPISTPAMISVARSSVGGRMMGLVPFASLATAKLVGCAGSARCTIGAAGRRHRQAHGSARRTIGAAGRRHRQAHGSARCTIGAAGRRHRQAHT